ncbi:MAG: diguanylate cyclase [Gammaproteobacteria bacterium]|nr:diguanylate cyclase [Gammaproteobacteria bacterium]NIR97391.1 diguanylate cyclase [Gammaproteobacteria bacterium]NIT63044.1 diguanylate cyclase [Gammaproteobacteria bacterium]NIV20006.1 diguanylate cyclase [Gammaproteobacteria bacterium]NIX10082.1 diguanylate cyclase [Gammaproteobacteria bacterium]
MRTRKTGIMVVDGSEVSRTIISRILHAEMDDTRITTSGTGEEALARLKTGRFDLITTALMLPDMDGLDLALAIRQSETHHYTPIIVVSGDADTRLLREGFNAGVTDYFDKSLGYQAFLEFIKDFTRRNSGLVGRILYVEDSRTAAMVTCHIMEKHGLKVTHTSSAEQALELLEQTGPDSGKEDEAFDIVITDFYLSGKLTGGDLLHAIRTRLHYSQQEMPVLVVTVADNDERQAEVFHAGANDFVTKPIIEEILIARIRSLLLIKQQFNGLKRQAEEMRRIAATDSLTGVRSRRYMLDHGEALVAGEENQPACAMLMDIDHLKQINDNMGHVTGDHVLAALGELLNQSFGESSMVVRFGGEEFAVILPRCDVREAGARAEALRRKVEGLRPADVPVTLSIGMACTVDHPDMGLNRLFGLADKALYAAKEAGRNRVCVHTGSGVDHGPAVQGPAPSRDSADSAG